MLKHFNESITLDKRIGVIIPQGLEKSEAHTTAFIRMFTDFFGGASVQEERGTYTMEDGSIAYDNNLLVYAWYTEMSERQEEVISQHIELMKQELKQECIGLELNNQFHLIF